MLAGKRVLLVIGGGIAAYKSLSLVRLLRGAGAAVTPVLTKGGAQFVTPLSVAALAGEKVHLDLFDLTEEAEMGHIQLSRVADLIVVAPATADLMSRMVAGQADDLAATMLLATDTRVLLAPAMNVRMWRHAATQRNVGQLESDGILLEGPEDGEMACGEFGPGRMAEPEAILGRIQAILADGPLRGKHAVVTSGPTHEPIDPVRFIANRSSGAQGAAIAAALRDLGARVTFVTGPAQVAPPDGVDVRRVETALQMLEAVEAALPAEVAVFAAAVADWRVANSSGSKMKKDGSGRAPDLRFTENPDILATISRSASRPELVVGFAAETDDVMANAMSKRTKKGCDWIVANDVSSGTGIMGGSENAVTLITDEGADVWPRMSKDEVARQLAARIAAVLTKGK